MVDHEKQHERENFDFKYVCARELLAASCAKLAKPDVGHHELELAADNMVKMRGELDRDQRKKDQLKERPLTLDREIIMARLARKIGRGRDAIYHGTRHLPAVLRMGKLLPSETGQKAV